MNRRKFLQGASTACSLMIVKPSVAFSYAAELGRAIWSAWLR